VIAIGDLKDEQFAQKCRDNGFEYRSVSLARNGLNPLADLQTLKELTALLKEIQPDRVFCTFAKAISYGCWAAHRAGISETYALVSGLGHIFRSSSFKARLVCLVMSQLYKHAFRCCKTVVFQNNDDLMYLVDRGLLPQEKTVIVNGSGVDLERYARTDLPRRQTFLFVGRLLGEKGIREYIEAAKRVRKLYPEARFLVVGDTDTNPDSLSQKEVEAYRSEGLIEFDGFQEDVRPYIRQCDVFVLPSYHEGTPRCVLEAMSMGRPIITSQAPGCRETVKEGENGFLIPVGDAQGIADKMIYFIKHPDEAQQMGLKSRCMAERKYDVNEVNADYFNIMKI
jgi:glycosyltransferase involved in cell wall biosynthesis